MTPQELDILRKETKHKMIDLDLDREGSYDLLLPHLNKAAGFAISKSTLSMALTGYRNGQKHWQVLEALHGLLTTWPSDRESGPAAPL